MISIQGSKSKPFFYWVALLAFIFVGKSHAAGCGCWVPSSGAGFHVALVVYDIRPQPYPSGNGYPAGINAQIQVVLQEEITSSANYISRFFYFNTADQAQLSKANSIYSALLTAKSTGEMVSISIDTNGPSTGVGSAGSIAAVQLGANAAP